MNTIHPDPIRVAFLGAGRIGMMHLANLRSIAEVQVVVVADASLAAAQRGAALIAAARATDDPLSAINAPDVDVVLIATPTGTHRDLIAAAIRAGKPVWCEKPVSLTLADAEYLRDLAAEHHVPVMIGYMRRFDARYAEVKRRIDAGELGAIERFRGVSIDASPPNLSFIKTSGGICIDMLIHDFDLALYLVGEVESVHTWGSVLVDPGFHTAGDVDTVMVMLKFSNGALGVIEGGRRTAWGYDIRTEVSGSLARAFVAAPGAMPSDGDGAPAAVPTDSFANRFGEAYITELIYFFDCLRSHTTPKPDIADAMASLRIALAATESLREGRAVRIENH
jgi:myo-inositol 2-dehydrogenase/D-chiro-inositol 1-dehydrogenase